LLREKRLSLYASVFCAIAIGFALAAYQSNSSRELAQAALEAPTGPAKPDQMSNPSNSQPREKIPIAIATAQDLRRRLEFPGVVRAIPTRTVAVLSPVVGRISGVQIQLGDRVSEKQEIATIIVDDNIADQPSLQVQNQNGPRRISLRSPIAGSIIDVQTKLGGTVQRGSNVASVADLKAIWVTLDLSRRDVSLIAGKTAEIMFAAYPGTVFSGELQFGDTFRENAESAIGRIELNNPEISLKLNMSAVVTLFGPRELAIVVPKSGLVQKNDVVSVFVEVAACPFELRPIEVAFQQGEDAIVTHGLVPGDRVLAISVTPPVDRRLRTAC
jgi:multidrug efflux pump subunit AcrA (membrane-fusion protein)